MKRNAAILILAMFSLQYILLGNVSAQEIAEKEQTPAVVVNKNGFNTSNIIFDDKTLIEGYTRQYKGLTKEILLEMIKDDTLSPYQSAAVIIVFKEDFADEVVGREKVVFEKFLLRRMDRTDAAFVHVEILHALCILDRYRYFAYSTRALIQKLDHYNATVNEMAYNNLNNIIERGQNRAREARIIFDMIRKMLFLSRKKIATINEAGPRLSRKIKLLRGR